jgi:hypothetical protein
MAKRKGIKSKFPEIISYWETKIYEGDIGVDWCDADERCWRCGYKARLEKCHIIPHSLGGVDEVSNLVLLCNRCHKEAPNSTDKECMWEWIKATKVAFYDIFWAQHGLEEYEKIYNTKIINDLKNVDLTDSKKIRMVVRRSFENVSVHYGTGNYNTSTVASIIKNITKNLTNCEK